MWNTQSAALENATAQRSANIEEPFRPTFPRLMGNPLASRRRIALWGASMQHQPTFPRWTARWRAFGGRIALATISEPPQGLNTTGTGARFAS